MKSKKRKSSADTVGEARSDLAWKHVIEPESTERHGVLQDLPLTGFVCDSSGVITRFLRGGANVEVWHA